MQAFRTWMHFALAILVGAALYGCGSVQTVQPPPQEVNPSVPTSKTVDELIPMVRGLEAENQLTNLRFKVYLLSDYACGFVGEQVGDMLAYDELTPQQRVWLLRIRLDLGRSMICTASNPDPVTNLFQQLFVIRVAKVIVQREAPEALGPFAPKIIKAFETLDSVTWKATEEGIGRSLEPLNEDVEEWLKFNPDTERFWWPRETGILRSMADQQSQYFSGLFASVDRATQGIDRMNLVLDRVSFVMERMPLLLAWEMQLNVAEALARPDIQELMDAPQRLTHAIDRLDASLGDGFNGMTRELESVTSGLQGAVEQLHATSQSLGETQAALNDISKQLADTVSTQVPTLIHSLEEASTRIGDSSEKLATSLDGVSQAVGIEKGQVVDVLRQTTADFQSRGVAYIDSLVWRIGLGAALAMIVTISLSVVGVVIVNRLMPGVQRGRS